MRRRVASEARDTSLGKERVSRDKREMAERYMVLSKMMQEDDLVGYNSWITYLGSESRK